MALIEPVLEADEIQGNILGGFNKDHQGVVPLWFGDDAAQPKAWLRLLVPELTWLQEVHRFRKALKEAVALTGQEPADLNALWTNVSFSWLGIAKFTPQAETFDPVFKGGLPEASGRIFDPITSGAPGAPDRWLFGAKGDVPDALVIVAGDVSADVETRVTAIITQAAQHGVTCRHPEIGHNLASYGRPELAGHEHFGFKDGISQPGVRGRLSNAPLDYLTGRPADPDPTGASTEYSTTGDPLIWPGEFVLGYARQAGSNGRAAAEPSKLGPKPYAVVPGVVGPWWARNGSFLVYRRLRQDVAAFNAFIAAAIAQLRGSDEFAALTSERLGAMLVGRWASGAPLLLAKDQDDETLGGDNHRNNNFGFDILDLVGNVCPQAAHIRKVNPRDIETDQGGAATTLNHRILRRAIAYGPPLTKGAIADPNATDRGLLFLCYQASIGEQFEFLLQKWANDQANPNEGLAPDPGYGIDPIIGQLASSPKRYVIVGRTHQRVTLPALPWVLPTGGGYFFTPSRTALLEVLAA